MTVAGAVLLLLAAALFLASPAHAQNAPAKPTGFTATGGSHQVALAWTDPSDSTILRWQYRYKETGAYGSWTDVPGGAATTTSYTVTGLANSTQYTFQIRAGNSSGDSDPSDEKTATMAPAKPGFFTLTLFVDTPGVQLGWSSTDPNDSTIDKWQYRQKKGTGAFGDWTEIPKSDWYSFRLSLEADQYSFQIRAVNESGNGDPSHIRSATFAKGICSRTAAVQTAIIALYKSQKGKDLTCGEVTGKELYELSGGLNLGSKSLTSLKAGDFDGLGNLGGVSLSNNSLTTLPANVFKGLARVRSLSLDGNQLTALPAGVFDDFGGLNILSLNGNKLASLRSDVFASQPNLLEVHLWDNELTTLPAGVFSKLSEVRRLRLENNKLSSLPAGAFRGLWLEAVLNLSGNKLTTLTKGVFDGLKLAAAGSVSPSVALDLSGNDLTSLPAGVFDKLTKMRRLELQNNDLTSLPSGVFDKLPDLWMLNLNGNDIASLPADVFDKNPKLGWLDLGRNELASLTVDAFDGLSKLVQLRLNDNSLTKLPQAVFGDQSRLKILLLRGNALLCLPDIPQSVSLLTLNSNLRRDNMKPCAPTAPAAPALTGGHKKLDVSWQAPSHSIGGSVTDYDLRYRAGTSGAWTSWSHTGTGRTATITGLTNAVSYQVQVRAANTYGIGAWSAAGSASPVSGVRLVLSETGVTVAEGGTATYTVKLGVAPDADVTVAVARSSGDTSITVSGGSSLTFTTATWNTAQTVTLAAAEDPDLQNSTATITHTASSTGEYNGTTATLTATEGDNDTAGLVVPATVEVLEGGTKDYSVKLSQQPSADVTVTVTRASGDGSLSVKTGSSLAFSTTDWNIPQTVTLQAAQDPDHARGIAVFRHAASGGGYNGVTADLTATENDDDTLGMVLSKSSVKVPEGGQTAYTVKLGTRPTGGNVQVTVARKSGGDTDLTVKTGALLSFTYQNWDTPQDVVLQAAQDADALHGTAAFVHTSSGADYGGLSKELTATEADDEVGLVLSKTRATVPEGGTATYTVKLKGLPTATVTVTVGRKAGGDTHLTADTDSGTDGDQNTLTFTTTNWSTAQTVTLSAADDPDNVNGEAVFIHSAAGGQYAGVSAELTAVEAENERGMTLSKKSVTVPEGGGVTYTVKLNAAPSGDVTVTAAVTGDDDIIVQFGSSLKFTTTSWSTPKTVRLTATADGDGLDGTATITHTANGGSYNNLTATLTAAEADKDRKLIGVADSLFLSEGSSDSFKMGLNTVPSGTVTITVNKKAGGDPSLTVDTDPDTAGNQNTFTLTKAYNVNDPTAHHTIKVSAGDDADAYNAAESDSFTFTASGGGYDDASESFGVSVTDDDAIGLAPFQGLTGPKAGWAIGAGDVAWVREGGTVTVPVRLASRPNGDVTVTATRPKKNPNNFPWLTPEHADLTVDLDAGTPGVQDTMTFTFLNWNVPQNITLAAKEEAPQNANDPADDTTDSRGSILLAVASTADSKYTASQQINLQEADNDVTGRALTLSASSLSVIEGLTTTYTVALASKPDNDVVVTVARTSGDTDLSVSGTSSFTFTTTNWNTGQTVTLAAAQDDDDFTNGSAVFTHTATDGGFTGVTAELTARELDNDVIADRALTLSASGLTVPEGGTAAYTVALAVAPVGTVTVAVTKKEDGDSDLTASPDMLTFTTQNWSTAQRVTLRAAEDGDRQAGRAVFVHTATGGGYGYGGGDATVAELAATERENDLLVTGRALTVTPSNVTGDGGVTVPEGGTAAYTVALPVAPYGPVEVTVARASGGDPDLTAAPATLTFTATDWNAPQTVTLSAAEDEDREPGEAVFVHTASGGGFAGVTAHLTATESENDFVPGRALKLSVSSVTVPEGGMTAYAVALAVEPDGPVTVSVTKKEGGDADLTATLATLTFTVTDWNAPQTVMLSAAEDEDLAPGEAVFVHTATGGGYGAGAEATVAELPAVEGENDFLASRTLALSVSSVTVPEGGTASYTVALAVAPVGPVTVSVMKKKGGDGDLTAALATLTFTATDWSAPQTVTLSAAEDEDLVSGEAVFVHTATGGGYGAGVEATVAELTATEEDNDFLPGRALALSASSVTVPEGGTAAYTVALAVAPVGPVTVSVTKKEGGDADLTTALTMLTFTTTDWNAPQTVTLSAAEDEDLAPGEAVFVHTATGGGYGAGAEATVAELPAVEEENDFVPGRALALSASSVTVPEGKTASFTVALAVAPYDPVTVTVTRATGGDTDLTAAPATLTFTTTDWSAPQTVTLSAADDDDGEPGEAVFVHTATGGGYGAGAEATVAELTATEEDNFVPKARERLAQVNEAILPEILRAVVQHKIDNVVSRVVSQAVSGMIGTDDALATAAHLLARHGEAIQDGVFSWREALAGADFALPLSGGKDGADGKRGPGVAFWAMGDYLHLSDDRPVEWSGGLFGAHVGSDVRIGRNLRAGLGLSWEEGSFDYIHRSDDGAEVAGTEEVRMTSVYPYAGWRFPGGSNLWATVGYGQGEVEFDDSVLGRQTGDLRQLMAAAGGTTRLAEAEGALFGGEGTLDVKTQVSLGRLAVADNGAMLPKTSVSAYGARVALEGSEAIGLTRGGKLTPSLEAGFRWDGGDGETGAGLELGGGLDYAYPALGLSAGARGRALVAHESGLREWGASGWLRLAPDSLGRGLSLEASPSWGESASGVDDLWQRGVAGAADKVSGEPPQMRFDVEVGYGLAAPPGRRGLLTPYAGFGVTEGGTRSYRAGTRLELGAATMIDLEGRRDDDAAGASDHAVDLRMRVYW